MPLESVFMLHDRYKVEALLGHGGMGAVYRAFDTLLDIPCAIKEFRLGHLPKENDLPPKDILGGTFQTSTGRSSPSSSSLSPNLTREKAAEQFKREAKLLASLDHPNLPKVNDYFSIDYEYYLVMTLIEGKDLATLWEEQDHKPFPQNLVMTWMGQIIDALAYCHSKGVIHRDVKPGNVLVTRSDKVYLVDFGIAKNLEREQASVTVTQMMTPGFSPPEQYAGAGRTDKRSDIYSLGATLYLLMTGQRPIESVVRVMGRELTPPGEINKNISIPLAGAIMRALALQPAERFQSIAELKEILKEELQQSQLIPEVKAEPITPHKEVKPEVFIEVPFEKQLEAVLAIGKERQYTEQPHHNQVIEELPVSSLPPEPPLEEVKLEDKKEKPDSMSSANLDQKEFAAFLAEFKDGKSPQGSTQIVEGEEGTRLLPREEMSLPDNLIAPNLSESTKKNVEGSIEDRNSIDFATPQEVLISPTTAGYLNKIDAIIASFPPFSKIKLNPGIYELEETMQIDQSLRLIGSGYENTTILCKAEGCVVHFTGSGTLFAEGLTFQHDGDVWANILEIEGGEINLSYCCFAGAKSDEDGQNGGNGIRISGKTEGSIHHCEMKRNTQYGIVIEGESQPVLFKNVCCQNGKSGISFHAGAGGISTNNNCSQNEASGIEIGGESLPRLVENICQYNKQAGIIYYGSAAGIASENQCLENEFHGIQIGERAHPSLKNNICSRNKQVGIQYLQNASGVAQGNHCQFNKFHGICASGESWATLEANICAQNNQDGIIFFGSTVGVLKENHCDENGLHGIEITGNANPQLESNVCSNNNQIGIRYSGAALGMAIHNYCEGNNLYGMEITENAQPRLEANTCRKNHQTGILYASSAAGLAKANRCEENEKFGIGVSGQSRPTLRSNICRNNYQSGILYTDKASGFAYGNQCIENGTHGIQISAQSQPQLEQCSCLKNRKSGFAYFDVASGLARKNTCTQNREYGFALLGQGQPVMIENFCSENGIDNVNIKL
jgi:parallel beta-helix repeat protein